MLHVQIRLQQEKIWEIQAHEETLRTELGELKGTQPSRHRVKTCVESLLSESGTHTVELKVKKRMLNSKTRLAEQLEVCILFTLTLLSRAKV